MTTAVDEPDADSGVQSTDGITRDWRGKQFMQISGFEYQAGDAILFVRPARKEVLGESFETKPIEGPYSQVMLLKDARILTLDGESGTTEAFIKVYANLSRTRQAEGFDLTFNDEGDVVEIEWLFNPTPN